MGRPHAATWCAHGVEQRQAGRCEWFARSSIGIFFLATRCCSCARARASLAAAHARECTLTKAIGGCVVRAVHAPRGRGEWLCSTPAPDNHSAQPHGVAWLMHSYVRRRYYSLTDGPESLGRLVSLVFSAPRWAAVALAPKPTKEQPLRHHMPTMQVCQLILDALIECDRRSAAGLTPLEQKASFIRRPSRGQFAGHASRQAAPAGHLPGESERESRSRCVCGR